MVDRYSAHGFGTPAWPYKGIWRAEGIEEESGCLVDPPNGVTLVLALNQFCLARFE